MNNRASVRPAKGRKASAAGPVQLDRGELDDTLGFQVRRAWVYMEQLFNRYMAQTGITAQLYAILIVIENNPGCRISDLCRAVGVSPNNIVPALDVLLDRGLVFRDFSAHDRRTKRLSLTETGRSTLEELRGAHRPMVQALTTRLGEQNIEKLVSLLKLLPEEAE